MTRKNLKQITNETYQTIASFDAEKGISQLEQCIEKACDSDMGITLRKRLLTKFDQFIKSRAKKDSTKEARDDAKNNLIDTLTQAMEHTDEPMAWFGAQEIVRDFETNYLKPALEKIHGQGLH